MSKIAPFRKAAVRLLATHRLSWLEEWKEEDWARHFYWLDRSGLALPIAALLIDSRSDKQRIPESALESLHRRLQDNERRMRAMLASFDAIQSLLTEHDVPFCCLKGFSLIPDCYSSIRERHQVDFDVLVESRDIQRAAAALVPLGYKTVCTSSSGETRLVCLWKRHLTSASWLYDISEGTAIELHTRLWEPETELVDFPMQGDWKAGVLPRVVEGATIPCLSPEWQLIQLLLHVFRHLLDSWVRLLSTYEIAVIIARKQLNDSLWKDVCLLAKQDPRLASACALVLSIVSAEFAVALPAPLAELCREHLSKESALWVENFQEEWLYADPPGSKLSLLVQRQFCSDRAAWTAYSLRRLFPIRLPHSLSVEASKKSRFTVRYALDALSYHLSRIGYHLSSDWNYLISLARWNRLTDAIDMRPFTSPERS